jgi:CBS domain-containing protein
MHIVCPSCGYRNIEGSDRCSECLQSLMNLDLPSVKHDDIIQELIMTCPVSAILGDSDVLVAEKTDTIAKIVESMCEYSTSSVLIYEKRKLVGIISERRLLTHVALKYDDLTKVTAEEIMTHNPEFVQKDAPLAHALHKMSISKFRHIPVLDDVGRPLSILRIADVLNYLKKRHRTAA